jgi:hypothetical protein
MDTIERRTDLRELVRRLSADAADTHGVPACVADRASAATLRRFAGLPPASAMRVGSYYWAVVRGTALRSRGDAGTLRARYLAASLVEDLLSAGHPRERVREEVARRFGASIPPESLANVERRAAQPATGTWPI